MVRARHRPRPSLRARRRSACAGRPVVGAGRQAQRRPADGGKLRSEVPERASPGAREGVGAPLMREPRFPRSAAGNSSLRSTAGPIAAALAAIMTLSPSTAVAEVEVRGEKSTVDARRLDDLVALEL